MTSGLDFSSPSVVWLSIFLSIIAGSIAKRLLSVHVISLQLGIRILIFSVNPIRRDANTYAVADTNQGQHARISRTCPGACCAFDDSFCMRSAIKPPNLALGVGWNQCSMCDNN